jgi:2,3-bisphosphoglycerate-dependent phosphoglycerate mutase
MPDKQLSTGHRFVLLRHGQSQWNLENRFTGWTDVPLTDQGRQEARQAARLLLEACLSFDIACTSVLQRAEETLQIVLAEMGLSSIPVVRLWQLNERHYGALQGLNKAETALQLGEPLVMSWRRSYADRPPALEPDDPRHPRFDPLYAALSAAELPATESLKDTEERLLPCWQRVILPTILSGKRLLLVAHSNSLRALVRYLDQIPEQDVPALNIPTGLSLVYETDLSGRPVQHDYLSKPSGAAVSPGTPPVNPNRR